MLTDDFTAYAAKVNINLKEPVSADSDSEKINYVSVTHSIRMF